jgi:hypothetical protein
MMKGMARLLGICLRVVAVAGAAAFAMASVPNAMAGVTTPEPEIAMAKAAHCIRDDEYMIRHHPDMLKHQRVDTLRRGIRSGDFSLKHCMECHSNYQTAGNGPIKTDCDNCHEFAAVELDCWDCHAKRPPKTPVAPVQADRPSPMMTSVPSGGTN